MLELLTGWLLQLVKDVFSGAWDFISDIFVSIADTVFTAVAALLAAIPVPQWASGGLQPYFAQLPSGTIYLLLHSGIVPAFALIGSAYAFRLLRKVVTLFQW